MAHYGHKRSIPIVELSLSIDESAFLPFRTPLPDYMFAAGLNQLYGLQLYRSRMADTPDLAEQGLLMRELFLYYDNESRLLYVLLDNTDSRYPLGQSFEYFDKVLIVIGENSYEQQQLLYEELSDTAHRHVESYDVRGQMHEELRYDFVVNNIVEANFFRFPCVQTMQDALLGIALKSEGGVGTRSKISDSPVYGQPGYVEDFEKQQGRTRAANSYPTDLPNVESSFLPGMGGGSRQQAKRRHFVENLVADSQDILISIENFFSLNDELRQSDMGGVC